MTIKQFYMRAMIVLACAGTVPTVHADDTFSHFAYITIKTCINAGHKLWTMVPSPNIKPRLVSWYRSWRPSQKSTYTAQIIPLSVVFQDSADCGYHGVFNGGNALRYAREHAQMTTAGIQDAVWREFTPLPEWKNYTQTHCKGRTTLIDDQDVVLVARECAKIPAEQMTVINNIGQFNPTHQLLKSEFDSYINGIEKVRTVTGSSHLFLLGNMSNYLDEKGKVRGSMGHWIAVVAYRTSVGINYYVMDSMNGGSSNDALVEKLRYWVEQQNNDQLRRAYKL